MRRKRKIGKEAKAVIDFWFEDCGPNDWFAHNEKFDQDIAEKFGQYHRRADTGQFEAWTSSPEGALALVIILDQFSRNIYRGDRKAYTSDTLALRVAREAIAQGFDEELMAVQRKFLYMPFQHSEDMSDQRISVRLYGTLMDPETSAYAERHKACIERFGRFPGRNKILGRRSTPTEEEALAKGEVDF